MTLFGIASLILPKLPKFWRTVKRRVREEAVAWREDWNLECQRHFLWVPVWMAVGIGLYWSWLTEPPLWLSSALGIIALIGLCWVWQSDKLRLFGVVMFCVMFGWNAAAWRTARQSHRMLDTPLTVPVWVEAKVKDAVAMPQGVRVWLESEDPMVEDRIHYVRVQFRQRPREVPLVGSVVRARLMLYPPPRPAMAGGYDFRFLSYFQGLDAVGYGVTPWELVTSERPDGYDRLQRWRQQAATKVIHALGDGRGHIASALLFGEYRGMPDAMVESLRVSGLTHILSVSGMHITLVTLLCMGLVRACLACSTTLATFHPIHQWAMLAGAVGAVSYWAISGMQIAASRACFMALWWIVGRWLGRPSDGLWSIGWAAIVILAVQPEALVHPSFHMSFAAVACLMGVRPPMIARPWLRVPAHWFWASLLAGLATAPFAMYHFHVQYLSGLLANMAATPLTSFCLMPAVVAIFLLWPLGLESFGLEVLGLGVDGLLWISGVSAVSSWSLHWPTMPLASLLWITVGLLACLVWQRPRWRWLGAVAMGVGAWIAIMSPVPDMLIDGLGQRFAVRDFGTGRWIYSHRGGSRFTRKQWDALAMVPGEALASEVSSLVLEKLQEGCWRYHHPRRTVAIATHEDCPRAEVSVHLDSRSWLRMEKAALRIRKDGEIEWIPVIHPASDRPWDPVVEMGRKDAGLQQKDDSKSIWGLHLG